MPGALHLTNGDSAVERLRAAGIEGEFVPWRDVLHEGPVPAGLPLAELSLVRARFIAGAGWAGGDEEAGARVRRDFAERDAALERAAAASETVLWFEHDLYDQLQLLQLLDWFAVSGVRPALAQCDDDYLGRLEPDAVRALFARRAPVTDAQFALARRAWAAFRADTPLVLAALTREDTSALPHLAPAAVRLLEEYPAVGDGLARTERAALQAIAGGAASMDEAFAAVAALEERVWLGDTAFADRLAALGAGERPLLTFADGSPVHAIGGGDASARRRGMTLTPLGRAVLEGREDRVAACGIDRWYGGVHLSGSRVPWRWDRERGRLVDA